jgi:hypothetical protein
MFHMTLLRNQTLCNASRIRKSDALSVADEQHTASQIRGLAHLPSEDATTAVNKQSARHYRIVVSPPDPAFDQAGRQGQWQSQS